MTTPSIPLPRGELHRLLDALVLAVAEDPASNKGEFETATDVLAGHWRRGEVDQIEPAILDLDRIDREDYEEWAQDDDEHDGCPPELPEPDWHRHERLTEWYLAPGDVAACAVLAWLMDEVLP